MKTCDCCGFLDVNEDSELCPRCFYVYPEETVVIYWPDGMWTYHDCLPEFHHRSDDYGRFKVPAHLTEEEVNQLVQERIK